MAPISFIFLSGFLLSVVQASVFNINVIDEDNLAAGKLSECNLQQCDEMCRRLGLSSGSCVAGTCYCLSIKEYAKAVIENEASEMNEVITDSYHSEVMGGCSLRACEQLCRRLGFPGGACVNGKCDCDRFKDKELSSLPHPLGCNILKCNLSCMRRGYRAGICVKGSCECI